MTLLLSLVLPFVAVIVTLAQDAVITDPALCHCQENFVARPFGDEGQYRCHGLYLKVIKPCNALKKPHCSCTDATGILTDHTGVWCAQYGGGREVRRWRCENGREWEDFFRDHPDQRFQEIAL